MQGDSEEIYNSAKSQVLQIFRTGNFKHKIIENHFAKTELNVDNSFETIQSRINHYNGAKRLRNFLEFVQTTIDDFSKEKEGKIPTGWSEFSKNIKTEIERNIQVPLKKAGIKMIFFTANNSESSSSDSVSQGPATINEQTPAEQVKKILPKIFSADQFLKAFNQYNEEFSRNPITMIPALPNDFKLPDRFFRLMENVAPFKVPELTGTFFITEKFEEIELLDKKYYYFGQFDFDNGRPCGVGILIPKIPEPFWDYEKMYLVLGHIGRPGAFCYENRVFCEAAAPIEPSEQLGNRNRVTLNPPLQEGMQILDYDQKGKRKVYKA